MKAPARVKGGRGLTDDQARLDHGNHRRADAKASGTVPLVRPKLLITKEKVRTTEVIDERRPKHTGDTQQALISPRKFSDPIRWIRVGTSAEPARPKGTTV